MLKADSFVVVLPADKSPWLETLLRSLRAAGARVKTAQPGYRGPYFAGGVFASWCAEDISAAAGRGMQTVYFGKEKADADITLSGMRALCAYILGGSRPLDKDENGRSEQEFLESYRPGDYKRPSVTVDMLMISREKDGDKILMIRRRRHPFINTWALPGGFVEYDEDIDDAAKRELYEETGLAGGSLRQFRTYGDPKRDPRMRVITVAYIALVEREKLRPEAGDDAADAKWFTVKKTDSGDTAEYSLIPEGGGQDVRFCLEKMHDGRLGIVWSELGGDHAKIIGEALDNIESGAGL